MLKSTKSEQTTTVQFIKRKKIMFLALVHLPEILIGIGAALTWLFYYPWHRAMHDYRVKLSGRYTTFSGTVSICSRTF